MVARAAHCGKLTICPPPDTGNEAAALPEPKKPDTLDARPIDCSGERLADARRDVFRGIAFHNNHRRRRSALGCLSPAGSPGSKDLAQRRLAGQQLLPTPLRQVRKGVRIREYGPEHVLLRRRARPAFIVPEPAVTTPQGSG